MKLKQWLDRLPLVAILRGLRPEEAVDVGRALSEAGFRLLEVPLNSPRPMESIRLLADALGDNHLVGAGTVMTAQQVSDIAAAGGRLIVMPHADAAVIGAAKAAGLVCTPGVATPTEAFAALDAGADGLKIFPAGQVGPGGLKAWRASCLPMCQSCRSVVSAPTTWGLGWLLAPVALVSVHHFTNPACRLTRWVGVPVLLPKRGSRWPRQHHKDHTHEDHPFDHLQGAAALAVPAHRHGCRHRRLG